MKHRKRLKKRPINYNGLEKEDKIEELKIIEEKN